jgi:hypothetical protein
MPRSGCRKSDAWNEGLTSENGIGLKQVATTVPRPYLVPQFNETRETFG